MLKEEIPLKYVVKIKYPVLVIEEVETKEQTCQVQERVILEMTVAFFYTPVECYMHLCMIHV